MAEDRRGNSVNLRFVVSTLAVLLCATPGVSLDDSTKTSAEICNLEKEIDHAIVTRDTRFLADILTEDYQHINFRGDVTDKKTELEFFSSPDFAIKGASIESCNVRLYREVAIATGLNKWDDAIYRRADISGVYRYTTVYVLEHNRWRVAVGHASRIPRGEASTNQTSSPTTPSSQ
jgi:hypothetical protein